ncbi:MAG: MIP family channel protein [Muribaculaceae bacterium]|nr:MIP family channel protein [Muribaculaceae bacterium]
MKKYLAECVGTFVLTFLGCGAAVSLGCNTAVVAGTPAVIGTAIAFGLAVVAMAYTIGGISGCHINPAITLGVFLNGGINAKDCGMYMVFQTIGAILAACVLGVLAGFDSGLGANGLQTLNEIGQAGQVSVTTGLIAEIVLTMLFVLVVLGATSKTNGATNNLAGLAIGLSLILIHLVGIHYTGTSVNPARSIGPALLAGGDALNQLWIFIVGPFIGGALAACIWKVISLDKEVKE